MGFNENFTKLNHKQKDYLQQLIATLLEQQKLIQIQTDFNKKEIIKDYFDVKLNKAKVMLGIAKYIENTKSNCFSRFFDNDLGLKRAHTYFELLRTNEDPLIVNTIMYAIFSTKDGEKLKECIIEECGYEIIAELKATLKTLMKEPKQRIDEKAKPIIDENRQLLFEVEQDIERINQNIAEIKDDKSNTEQEKTKQLKKELKKLNDLKKALEKSIKIETIRANKLKIELENSINTCIERIAKKANFGGKHDVTSNGTIQFSHFVEEIDNLIKIFKGEEMKFKSLDESLAHGYRPAMPA